MMIIWDKVMGFGFFFFFFIYENTSVFEFRNSEFLELAENYF